MFAKTPVIEELSGFIAKSSLFSRDGKLLFLVSRRTVLVHSVRSGDCVCQLQGHSSDVVSLLIHPNNPLNLLSLDCAGVIKCWDFTRGKCVFTVDVSQQLPEWLQQSVAANAFSQMVGTLPRADLFDTRYDLDDYSSELLDADWETASTVSTLSSLLTSTAPSNNGSSLLKKRSSAKCKAKKTSSMSPALGSITEGDLALDKVDRDGDSEMLHDSDASSTVPGEMLDSMRHSIGRRNAMAVIYLLADSSNVVRVALLNNGSAIVDVILARAKRRKVHGSDSRILSLQLSTDGGFLCLVLGCEVALLQVSELEKCPAEAVSVLSYVTGGWPLCGVACFHPENKCLAFGDARGSVNLWNDFSSLFSLSSLPMHYTSSKTDSEPITTAKSWSLAQWLAMDDLRQMGAIPPVENKDKGKDKAKSSSVDEDLEETKQNGSVAENNMNSVTTTTEVASISSGGSWKKRVGRQHLYLMQQMHWHSHAVSSLAFTSDGAYLLSGGEESVLMATQLDTGRRQPLPRLGGAISHIAISPDQVSVAVSLDSNIVRLVDSVNNRVTHSIEGVGVCHRPPRMSRKQMKKGKNAWRRKAPLVALKPATSKLRNANGAVVVLQSHSCTLQVYDTAKERSLGSLQLRKQQIVSRTNERQPDVERLSALALNSDGSRMAAVLIRSTPSILAETGGHCVHLVTLQIWHYQAKSGQFVLNTRIESPHGAHAVDGLVFDPSANRLLSYATRGDNQFKLWSEFYKTKYLKPTASKSLADGSDFASARHLSWRSSQTAYHNTGSVHLEATGTGARGVTRGVRSAQFSCDGTVLFTAGMHVVSVWDSRNLILLRTVSATSSSPLLALCTVRSLPGHFAAVCRDAVTVWDSLTLKPLWTLPAAFQALIGRVYHCQQLPQTTGSVEPELLVAFQSKTGKEYIAVCRVKVGALESEGSTIGMKAAEGKVKGKTEDSFGGVLKQLWAVDCGKLGASLSKCSLIVEPVSTGKGHKDYSICIFSKDRGVLRLPKLNRQWKRLGAVGTDAELPTATDSAAARRKRKRGEMEAVPTDTEEDDDGFGHGLVARRRLHTAKSSLFDKLFGAIPLATDWKHDAVLVTGEQMRGEQTVDASEGSLVQLLDGPTHTLPPFSSLFDDWMATLLPQKRKELTESTFERMEETKAAKATIGTVDEIPDVHMSDGTITTESGVVLQMPQREKLSVNWTDDFSERFAAELHTDSRQVSAESFVTCLRLFSMGRDASL